MPVGGRLLGVCSSERIFHACCADVDLIDHSPPDPLDAREPFTTLVRAFSSYEPIDRDTYAPLIPYLLRMSVPAGTVLWNQDDAPDGLYIVESGILRATYRFADPTPPMVESMVPGTIAGELSALSGLERNATCVVERAAVVWKLSGEDLASLEEAHPELARAFTRLVLKGNFCLSRILSVDTDRFLQWRSWITIFSSRHWPQDNSALRNGRLHTHIHNLATEAVAIDLDAMLIIPTINTTSCIHFATF